MKPTTSVRNALLLLPCLAMPCLAGADELTLLRDLDTRVYAGNGAGAEIAESADHVYFTATTTPTGLELWTTDGTEAGTRIALDLAPGREGSAPASLVDLNGTLYFSATRAVPGVEYEGEIWRTEGTAASTELLMAFPRVLITDVVVAGDLLYFAAGSQLWRTDGTPGGTLQLAGVPAFDFDSSGPLVAAGADLYFVGYVANVGLALMKTDGTVAGTVALTPFAQQQITPFAGAGGLVLFQFNDPATGIEPWVSDGTPNGTMLLKDINPGPASSRPGQGYASYFMSAAVGSAIYFPADDGVDGQEIWVSDGTPGGTHMVADTDLGIYDDEPGGLTAVGGLLYFSNSSSLWKTDGTEAGTILVKQGGVPQSFTNTAVFDDRLYFADRDLWVSDGTETGTHVFDGAGGADLNYARGLTVAQGQLWFVAQTLDAGYELWRSDGTEAGTQLVADISSAPKSGAPESPTPSGGSLYFTAVSADYVRELWRTNGTEAGTLLVKDVGEGTFIGDPVRLTDGDGVLYFNVSNDRKALWRSDGTEAGTYLVAQLVNGGSTGEISDMAWVQGVLVAGVRDDSDRGTVWRSDGTAAGTSIIAEIDEDFMSSITDFTGVGNRIFFDVGAQTQDELWTTDLTAEGTTMLGFFRQIPTNRSMWLTGYQGQALFTASPRNYENDTELWHSDGTPAGTALLKDIAPGHYPASLPEYLTVYSQRLYFAATSDENRELWSSDGTEAGTVLVADLNPGGNSDPRDIVATRERLLFAATTPDSGEELWTSDGTTQGTVQVADIYPGPYDSIVGPLFVVGNTAFFQANDGVHGEELWRSDGTPQGTSLAADVVPGTGGSAPEQIAFIDGAVVFSADDGVHGRELWALRTNIAPYFVATPPSNAVQGVPLSWAAQAADPNPMDTASYELTEAPAGASIDVASGMLQWTPSAGQIGTNTFQVHVRDEGGLSDSLGFDVEVLADSDLDGVPDAADNCTDTANPDQTDSDADGYGNACDGDIATPNDCLVNFLDLGVLRTALFSEPGAPQWNPDADLDGDGRINFVDAGRMKSEFFGTPGPSGPGGACAE